MTLLHIVVARPNFMKVAPVWRAIAEETSFQQKLVHTGQRYNIHMSDIFFTELGLHEPDHYLGVGSSSHARQTAATMVAFEEVINEFRSDIVLVYGDVNAIVATALVCAKLMIPVGHVEAGLRSFDRSMPEEINRLLTDQISGLLFTSSKDADENLVREGILDSKIHFVGNVMIDMLVRLLPKAKKHNLEGLSDKYALVTLHRPSNVDDPVVLNNILKMLSKMSGSIQVLFPIHPRTRQRITDFRLGLSASNKLKLMETICYPDIFALQREASVVITDSGGIQVETTYLGVPCLTIRENTERPITITMGTNTLVGNDMELLKKEVGRIIIGNGKQGQIPPLWDGQASLRIVNILQEL